MSSKVIIFDTSVLCCYAQTNAIDVEILTGDQGLKAYQPTTTIPQPRRRR